MSRPHRHHHKMRFASERIDRPARFERWEVGDSLPVARPAHKIERYWKELTKQGFRFTARAITPTLTRVTRIA